MLCLQVWTSGSMVVGLQVAGLVLGLVSWCLQSSCTWSQTWKVKSQADSVTTSSSQFEGLWMSCASSSTGSVQCSRFRTVLGLSGETRFGFCAITSLSRASSVLRPVLSVFQLTCRPAGL